jgi:plastocyanin
MKIKTPILIVIAVVVLGGLFFLFKPKTDSVAPQLNQTANSNEKQVVETKTIVMKPNSFEPKNITVQKNTRVIFKNEDTQDRWPASALHPTHGIYPEFDPQAPVMSGKEWSFVFDKVGSWKYHDHLIPSLTGEITVVDGPVASQTVAPNTHELIIQGKKLVSGPATIKVNQGDEVTIKITSDETEEFHVHAYDNSVELEPGKQATLTFKANLSGRFPFELENSKTEIGALEVQPK